MCSQAQGLSGSGRSPPADVLLLILVRRLNVACRRMDVLETMPHNGVNQGADRMVRAISHREVRGCETIKTKQAKIAELPASAAERPIDQPRLDAMGNRLAFAAPESIHVGRLRTESEFVAEWGVSMILCYSKKSRQTRNEVMAYVLVKEQSNGSVWVYDGVPSSPSRRGATRRWCSPLSLQRPDPLALKPSPKQRSRSSADITP